MNQLKFFSAGIILAMMFVTFQNCAKQSTSSSSINDSSSAGMTRTSASAYSVIKVDEYALVPSVSALKVSSEQARILEIDLENGTVYIIDRDGQKPGEMYNLKNEDQENLKGILASAEICEPLSSEPPPDTVCTMQYIYPYVELINGDVVKKLGEKSNGCHVPVDLCDSKAQEFKTYLKGILAETAARTY